MVNISRRGFLKGLAGLAAGGAVASVNSGCAIGYVYGRHVEKVKKNREKRAAEIIQRQKIVPRINIERWYDDGDGAVKNEELKGDIGEAINNKNAAIYFDMGIFTSRESVVYTLLDENDKVCWSYRAAPHRSCTLAENSLSPGKYTINAVSESGRNLSREFRVLE